MHVLHSYKSVIGVSWPKKIIFAATVRTHSGNLLSVIKTLQHKQKFLFANYRDSPRNLPYSQKYWRSLKLVVWPQTDHKNIWAEFKFGSGISGPFIKEFCRLSFEVLEQRHEFANLQLATS